jgi:hypothetical protein
LGERWVVGEVSAASVAVGMAWMPGCSLRDSSGDSRLAVVDSPIMNSPEARKRVRAWGDKRRILMVFLLALVLGFLF